mgnify:CR=1 FL=1
MEHYIFKSNRTIIHKFILISSFITTLLLGVISFVNFLLSLLNVIEVQSIMAGDYFLLLLFPLSIFILITILKKNGLSIKENKLYNTSFLFNKPLKSIEINLKSICDVCILRFNVGHKTAFGTSLNPDTSITEEEFQIHLLNENHSKRKLIFTTNNLEEAKNIKNLIRDNLGFKYVTYSPPKSARRKKR